MAHFTPSLFTIGPPMKQAALLTLSLIWRSAHTDSMTYQAVFEMVDTLALQGLGGGGL